MEKVIDRLAVRAAIANPEAAGDYTGDDGLLYCGKCHTPKQTRKTILGKERVVPCSCQCRTDEQDKKAEQARAELVEQYQRRGGVSPAYVFDKADRSKALNACRRYAARWEEMERKNMGIVLWGGVGTGKTFAAHCICNELIRRPEPVAVFVTSLSRVLNSGYDKTEAVERIRRTPLVVFDDLGAERSSEYALETIFMLVDERYRARKPLLVTTNLTTDELKNPKDIDRKRIYDRILEMCVPLYFDGTSRREEEASEKLEIMRELLAED